MSRSVRWRSGRSRAPLREDIEPAPEAVAQLGGREQSKPRGRELDRERQPVEPRADLADDGGRLVVEAEARPRLTPALHEERDRRGAHRAGRAGRQRERRHGQELLAADPQCLAARHEEREPRALPDQLRGVVGCRHHLFEVVEHEEEPARPEVRRERLAQVVIARDREARRLGDRHEDGGRLARVREIDEEDAVGVVLEGVRRRLDGQPRLADPARSGQRHEPDRVAAKQARELLELGRAPHQRRRGDRKVVRRRVDRARRRELGVEALRRDLVEPLGRRQVLEAMLAEVSQARAGRHRAADERAGRLRREDLAAVGGRHDSRRPMDVDAHVDAGGQLSLAGVDADADLDVGASRPRLRGDRPLNADRGLDGVSGGPEDREERVTLGADLGAAAGTGDPDELVVPREQRAVVGPELLDEPRRALDVGEQEGGGPGRQLGHGPVSVGPRPPDGKRTRRRAPVRAGASARAGLSRGRPRSRPPRRTGSNSAFP